jgi:hypothetical protein
MFQVFSLAVFHHQDRREIIYVHLILRKSSFEMQKAHGWRAGSCKS